MFQENLPLNRGRSSLKGLDRGFLFTIFSSNNLLLLLPKAAGWFLIIYSRMELV
jgi:hypothetical protein